MLKEKQDKQGRSLSEPFMELPNKEWYPDYYVVIQKPMSYKEIDIKIEAGVYQSIDEFQRDVLQVFSNCQLYNLPRSQIYLDSTVLQTALLQRIAEKRHGSQPSSAVSSATHSRRHSEKILESPAVSESFVSPTDTLTPAMAFDAIKRGNQKRFALFLTQFKDSLNILQPTTLYDNTFTWTALHCAVYYDQPKFVEQLLQQGADVEAQDTWYGSRAIGWAAFTGNLKMCRLLIRYGANTAARNHHDQTALDLVSEDKVNPAWIELLGTERQRAEHRAKKEEEAREQARLQAEANRAAQAAAFAKQQQLYFEAARKMRVAIDDKAKPFNANDLEKKRLQAAAHQKKLQQQQQMQRNSIFQTPQALAASQLSVDPRFRQVQIAKQTQQQLVEPSYMHYAQQLKVTHEKALIASIGIVSNNEFVRTVIPFSSDDPTQGFCGYALTVGQNVKSLNIRLVLNQEPLKWEADVGRRYMCCALQGYTSFVGAHVPGQIVPVSRAEALIFKATPTFSPLNNSPSGIVQDCSAKLHDGLNTFDIVVVCGKKVDESGIIRAVDEEWFQSVVVTVNRL